MDFENIATAITGPMQNDVLMVVLIGIGLSLIVCGLHWVLGALGQREVVSRDDD